MRSEFLRLVDLKIISFCLFAAISLLGGCDRSPVGDNITGESVSKLREIEWSFGKVDVSEKYTHVFSIKNDSSQSWRIRDIITTCGCTTALPSKLLIAPGDSSEVEITYTSPKEPLNDKRTLTVVFHEASAPVVKLVVEATVRKPVSIFPQEVIVKGDSGSEAIIRRSIVRVENHSENPWSEVRCKCSEPGAEVVFERVKGANGEDGWRGDLTIKNASIGEDNVSAAIECHVTCIGENKSFESSFRIAVRREKWAKFAPEKLFFGEVAPGDNKVMTVHLIHSDSLHKEFLIESCDAPVTCLSSIATSNNLTKLTLRVDTSQLPSGVHKGSVVIASTLEPQKKAVLPYVLLVQ